MVQLEAEVSEVRGSKLIQQSGSSHTTVALELCLNTHTHTHRPEDHRWSNHSRNVQPRVKLRVFSSEKGPFMASGCSSKLLLTVLINFTETQQTAFSPLTDRQKQSHCHFH